MFEKYPVIAQGCGIFIEPYGGHIFSYEERNGVRRRISIQEHINIQACAILERCTGSYTIREIAFILEKECEDTPPDLLSQIQSFLDTAFEKGYITYSEAPTRMQGTIYGSTTHYTPERALIEVTTACNLSCGHCLLSAGEPLPEEVPVSEIIPILDHLFKIGVHRLTLSGGEVLTKKEWEALLDFCIGRFHSVLFTNAILVTEEIADKLKYCSEIHVSLYGSDPETHDKITQIKGSFERALKGTALLTERNAAVSASISVTPFNLEQLEDIIRLAISLKCCSARVGVITPMGRAQAQIWELTKSQKAWLDAEVKELQHKYKDTITIQWNEDFERMHKCGAGYTRWTITSNGVLYPCVLFRIPIGNLTYENPLDILKSPAVKFLEELETPHEALCGDCEWLYACKGCHGQALAHSFRVDHCTWAEQFETAPEPLKSVILKKTKEK